MARGGPTTDIAGRVSVQSEDPSILDPYASAIQQLERQHKIETRTDVGQQPVAFIVAEELRSTPV
jgi:hypothetical protein